jgi:methyl-accepting chemotaxis protein/aerotaxis receptor
MKQLISVTDLKGNYTYINQAYCQTTGYQEDELLNTDTRSLTHEQMPKAVLDELSAMLAKGFSWQGVLHLKSKAGKSIWLNVFITPQYNQNKIIGFQCISTIAETTLATSASRLYKAMNNQSVWAT